MFNFLQQIDGGILIWIQENIRSPLLTFVMIRITRLGDNGLIWILLTILLMIPRKTRKVSLGMAIALVMSLIVTNLMLKNSIARIRPYEVIDGLQILIEPQADWSFPSGHTSASMAAALVMMRMLPRKYGVPAMTLGILIALSRLYIGVHYLSDVLGGAVIGLMCAYISLIIISRFTNFKIPHIHGQNTNSPGI